MSNQKFVFNSCSARLCDYSIFFDFQGKDYGSCQAGGGSCAQAKMLTTTALPNVHNGHLQGAARAIQAILNGLAGHTPEGRELAFLNMGTGVLLGWVDHNTITPQNTSAQITEALQLEDSPYGERSPEPSAA